MGPYLTGGVYLVADKALRLVPEEERVVHDERRPVVVVTGPETNSDAEWPFVLVCPVSGSTGKRTRSTYSSPKAKVACGRSAGFESRLSSR